MLGLGCPAPASKYNQLWKHHSTYDCMGHVVVVACTHQFINILKETTNFGISLPLIYVGQQQYRRQSPLGS